MFEFWTNKRSKKQQNQGETDLDTPMIIKDEKSSLESQNPNESRYNFGKKEGQEIQNKEQKSNKSQTLEEKINDKKGLIPEGFSSLDSLRADYKKRLQKKISKDLCEWAFSGADAAICHISVSQDDRLLIVVTTKSVSTYDLTTRSLVKKFRIDFDRRMISGAAMSSDLKYMALSEMPSDYSKEAVTVGIYDFNTEQELFKFEDLHEDRIEKLLISADNKYLFTCSKDKSIKICDLEAKKELHHFKDIHRESVTSLVITTDGKYIISASKDKSIKILDIQAKQEVHQFQNIHQGQISTITISQDGKYLISGSHDNSIKIIDLNTKQLVHHIQNISDMQISCVEQSGGYLIIGFQGGSIKVLEFETKKEIHHFAASHDECIMFLIVLKNSPYLLSSLRFDVNIKVLDLESKKEIFLFPSPFSVEVDSIALSDDDKYLVSTGSTTQLVTISDFKTKAQICSYGHDAFVTSIAISPRNKYVASGTIYGSIKIFDLEKMEEIHCFTNVHENETKGLAISSDLSFLVSSDCNSIKIFDLENGQERFAFRSEEQSLTTFCLSKDDKYIIFGTTQSSISFLDIATQRIIYNLQIDNGESASAIALSQDQKYMVLGIKDLHCNLHKIRIFNHKTKELIYCIEDAHPPDVMGHEIKSICIGKDNKFMVSSKNLSLKIWDFQKFFELYHHKEGEQSYMIKKSTVAISNDYQHIVFGYKGIKAFSVESKEQEHKFEEVRDTSIKSPVFTSDNQYLICVADKKRLKIFDLKEKKVYQTLKYERRSYHSFNCLTGQENVIAISTPYGSNYIIALRDKNRKVIDIIKGDVKTMEEELCLTFDEAEDFKTVIISNDGSLIASIAPSIEIFEMETKKKIHHFKDCSLVNEFVVISNDNKYMVCRTYLDTIEIWNLQTGHKEFSFGQEKGDSSSRLIITPDNQHLVFSFFNEVTIFDIQTKQMVHVLKHKESVQSIDISHDGRYIICGMQNSVIKVIDLKTTRELKKINIHPYNIKTDSVLISRDNKNLVVVGKDNEEKFPLKLYSVSFGDPEELYFTASKILTVSPFTILSPFAVYHTILLEANDIILRNILEDYQDLYITPYWWTVMHLFAIFLPSKIPQLPKYEECKVPLIVDVYGRTPLHYLLAQETRDYLLINIMLEYILDYLEDKGKTFPYECRSITDSLSDLFLFIIDKTPPRLSYRYLNLCYPQTSIQHEGLLPLFGANDQKYALNDVPVMEPGTFSKIYTEGEEKICFHTNMIHLDYDPTSKDMLLTTEALSKMQNEGIFKLPLIENLIDHLWESTAKIMASKALLFSLLMILLSVYIGLGQRALLMEISITLLTLMFLAIEIIQIEASGEEYFKSVWNWVDLAQLSLVIVFITMRFVNDTHLLFQSWNASGVIVFGYLRWISYLRLFTPTRHLIQIILVVLYDMLGFLTIIASILIGFSLIFLQFSRNQEGDQEYGTHFYNAFKLLFGNYDDTDFSLSQILLVSSLLVILNVVLLNLLISIIADSYGQVKDKQELVDALSRLDMVQETIVLMRRLGKKSDQKKKGYLIYCFPAKLEEESEQDLEWKRRKADLKEMFKNSENKIRTEVDEVKNKMDKMEGEITQVKASVENLTQLILTNFDQLSKSVKNQKDS